MKFGIIGAGMIANFHAKAIAAMEAGELHSFYGRRQEAVDELVAENGGKGYTDLDEFLNDPELDIVTIATSKRRAPRAGDCCGEGRQTRRLRKAARDHA